MPRLMSVTLTEQQVIDRTKTVTRRKGWLFLKVGDRLTLCRKVMGRRKGDPLVRLAEVEVMSVRRERLQEMDADDVGREGFPDWSTFDFIEFFCDHMGGTGLQVVTRIEWRYLDDDAREVPGER